MPHHPTLTPPTPNPAPGRPIEVIARGLWIEHGHVLLCKNIAGGYFYLPGGHVEFREPASVALQREFEEEAGVAVKVGDCVLVGEASFEQGGEARHEINLVFHVEHGSPPAGFSPVPVRSLEAHIVFDWVPISGLAQVDVRPRWLANWVVAHAVSPASSRPLGTAWLSVMAAL